ncbi:MAG: C40 family peptidase [Deltaproteobacteria bacterium]|nr:C40 family peptidase [Deltaproteobacteria bacterium]
MKRRRIFLWMGLTVLFVSFLICRPTLAADTYKVQRGDCLSKISKKFHVSIQQLRDANHLQGNFLMPGDRLVIPASGKSPEAKSCKKPSASQAGNVSVKAATARYYSVKKGDSLYRIAKKTGVCIGDIQRLNHLRSNRLRIGQKLALSSPPKRPGPVREDAAATEEADDVAGVDSGDPAVHLDDDLEEDVFDETSLTVMEDDGETGSDLLGKWHSRPERQLLVKVAKGFIGAPYRFGGSSVRGIDCSAFVKKIYQIFDVILPRTAREQSRVGMQVSRSELEAGDLVFFNTRRPIGHVGIYIGNNEFVHAAAGRSRKVRISSLDEPYYNRRYVKAVRLKGLDKDM